MFDISNLLLFQIRNSQERLREVEKNKRAIRDSYDEDDGKNYIPNQRIRTRKKPENYDT